MPHPSDDDLERADQLARAFSRRMAERITSWDLLWTLAFRGTIVFGLAALFWSIVWAVLARLIDGINHPTP